jgi:hypothetical protein
MKHKATWHEYGLGLLLILSALEGGIRAFHGDVAAGIGTILLPAVFWLVFYWQHFWRDKPKPLNWADTVLGLLAWLWAIGFMIQHH